MLDYLHCEDSRGIGGCRTKNSPTLWQEFMHLQWNRCHIFTNKRGTHGIIADDLRFTTQFSNVYGNAIRHFRCQKLFLFPQSVAKQKKKAELFCKERLWKDISRSDGKDSTRSTRKKGSCLSMGLEKEKARFKNLLKHWKNTLHGLM